MEEPQVTTSEIEAEAQKSEINDILQSGFEDEKVNQIQVDEELNNQPGTSFISKPTEDLPDVSSQMTPTDILEEAGIETNVSMIEDDVLAQSEMEAVEFANPPSDLDITAQSEIADLDFTEASVNISQLDVANHDDSNDAFNALKESETDALQEPKEEVEEPKELDEEKTLEVKSDDVALETSDVTEIEPPTSVDTPMETDDTPIEVQESVDVEKEATSPVDAEMSQLDDIREAEEAEEIHGDDETTETTNEGEGVDEDLCLLGDETECDADKDASAQIEDVIEDESTTEASANITTDAVDEGSEDKEVVEPETTEVEEIQDDIVEPSPLTENEIREIDGETSEASCLNCENVAVCLYQVMEGSELKYLCTFNCVKEHREDNPDKYSLTQKKVRVYEIHEPTDNVCVKCSETKVCKYRFRANVVKTVTKDPPMAVEGEDVQEATEPITETVQSVEENFICDDECLKQIIGDNEEKYIVNQVKRRSERAHTLPQPVEPEEEVPKIAARTDAEVEAAKIDRDESFVRRCNHCFTVIQLSSKSIQWEAYDFCNDKCLGQYQNIIAATCTQCNKVVSTSSIGKLCVRFGPEIKQFCATECLNDFKKTYITCALCSKNLKNDENEENVTPKRGNQFCNEDCANTYDRIINPRKKRSPRICSVCNNKKIPKVEIILDENIHHFCSNPCFSAFKFVNNVSPDQCEMCTKYFERKSNDAHTIYQGDETKMFCTQLCLNIFITKSREIWQCNWCRVSKYSYDMIQLDYGNIRMCSLNCSSLHEVSTNALTRKQSACDHCQAQKQQQYHLTMSDSSIRNFCTYQCVMGFQSQFSKSRIALDQPSVVPAGTAKRIKPPSANFDLGKKPEPISKRRGRPPYNPITNKRSGSPIPVPELTVQLERLSDIPARVKVSSLSSLTGGPSSWKISNNESVSRGSSPVRVEHKTQVVTIPPLPKQFGNKSTMCKSITLNKAINCVPTMTDAECQTDDWLEQRVIVPVPIPIFVPQPMMMYSIPTPVAVPFVLPIPVPVFVPTTRNSASGIMKEIKKIQEKMPTDPYEAELLMMAEMVAGDKKREETDSDSDENNEMEYPDGIDNNASFNEDLVQMAFKMAGNDFDDPPVDLENEMTANTISQTSNFGDDIDPHSLHPHQLLLLQQQREAAAMQSNRGRKRIQQPSPKQTINRNSAPNKRIKREMEVMQPEIPREPAEKPDANMCLKYTFGVNAWKQWVATKNADFEKSSIRRKPIKSEILQLTADELNYSLCMFVKEVRKPNGSEYAPDTIYYLVLGIQQYLYENGRIDNIFTDRYYEQFTDCLDEVAKKFSVLYNDSQYIVTRVEEEHLWECKQLGAHSPHVLLSTLMFFNTKHFNLVTVDEHMELSFSHIMKHWKRNPNQPGAAKVPGSRNVLLRFYPPQSSLEANSRKKKVYEQQENEDNPLRCPVKLYEFYLSKCPESVKTRNDVFYLQPERSCVPDSPVWYSTQPLSRDALSKMLHRVKMVKEINIALLTS